ncbi:MAG: glycoside hydrolase family 15 protein [Myxococcaceae bacterium]|nr:glycoside hydrolase family 15 protein [Myxococcaceae bacterium]
MRYPPIDRFGVIGNMETVALVGMDGSIDFMCFPSFDSPSVFARLLDHEKGGFFQLAPVLEQVRHRQMYLPDTNVLFTRWLSNDGVAEVSDFMSLEPGEHRVVRRAKTVRGEIRWRCVCNPRFGYGLTPHQVHRTPDGVVFEAGGLRVRLRATVPLKVDDDGAVTADFTVRANEHASFVFEVDSGDSRSVHPDYVAQSFKETADYWRAWIAKSTYRGRWREAVSRSALVLKLLTSRRHGSMVAAPTFGLPEDIGGERNWDYRYTWIRDGSFTLYSLMRLGYTEEAAAFMRWFEERCRELEPDGSLQIMYAVDGRHELPESALDHFEGYLQSKPVRVGNGAYQQLQLDIYGELLDSVYLFDKYGSPLSYDTWVNLRRLVDWVCENWRRADEGIWEVRGGAKEFLFSRVMCWVALDRAVRLAKKRSFPAPLERWSKVRDEIYEEIFTRFWDPARSSFAQYDGAKTTDASMLLMPMVKFISPTDPRWLSTMKAIEHDLVDDSHVFRYRHGDAAGDGLRGTEGTFCICSFWWAECLARSGDLDRARYAFEKMLGYANHLGLFPEELGKAGEHLGNFPQAFTHIGLISAAYYLDKQLSGRDARTHVG